MQPVRELRKDGVVKREIPAPPTAEERRLQQEQAAMRLRERSEQREAQLRDEALLLRYRNVDEIVTVRERELAILRDRASRDALALKGAQERRDTAQAALLKAGDKASPVMQERLASAEQSLAEHQRATAQHDADQVAIYRKYEDISVRYRALTKDFSSIPDAGPVRASASSPNSRLPQQ